ncbi:uncharacterized protein LOC111715463 [Eurytemora carolleeae]|uniref:uncharacterized protein LOC111715463 n=1 Tax=Eurytemora carolleeae TaxID=1294199 RepID=UPI000C773C85|nr:uncharacterized protein LOC111715463 [Eurytemora carolleeae]|eukprot:XP_023346554.1 uncharacterized protein LOC111715463 [Eurytemora affinis]
MSPVCDFLLREQGWRLGLQMMCLILIPGIFICLFYRPASLYHPQRRAMQHIKFHQKRILLSRFNPADIGIFRLNYNYLCNRDVLLLLLSSALLSSGLWTPFFMIPQITISDKHIAGHITDLYLAFGISIFLGSLFSGILFSVRSSNCNIGIKNQVQSCSVLMGICICVYSCTTGYKGHMMFVVIYGLLTGSVLLSTKLFVYTQTRRTEFHTVWGLVQLSMGLPLLVSVLLSSMFSDGGYSFIVSGILVILSAVPIQWCHLTRLRLHTEKGMKERNEIFSNSKYIIKDYAAQNFSVKPVEDNNLKAEGKKENKKEIDENEKEDVSGLKEGKNEAVEMDEKILGNLEQFLYEDFITSCNKVENQVLQEELEQNKYIYSENQDVWAQNELVKQDVWAQDEFNIFLNKRRRYST